jgi:LysR family glycine cleavage system transcriptional activator
LNQISLNSIKVFAIAAQHLSFKRAAELLFVTPGAVSRQIRSLEKQLGVALFSRHYREVRLSPAGEKYYRLIQPALAQISTANSQLIHSGKRGVLKLDTPPTFALHWLIPRLANFKQQYPDITIEVTTSSLRIDLNAGHDVHVRRNPKEFSGLKGIPFMTEFCHLVCAPSLLKSKDNVEQLLLQHPLIHFTTRPDLWQQWSNSSRINLTKKPTDINFENTIFAIQAAIEGLGIALIPQVFLTELLRSNTLVCPFEQPPIATGDYYLLHHDDSSHPALPMFARWLREQS